MEKTLHDVHRERCKSQYPSHIMSIDELREYRQILDAGEWTNNPRLEELQRKYRALREYYVTSENYFKVRDKLNL